MTVRSMTGFGSARTTSHGWTVKVTCRSVNHRGLDTRIYVPHTWSWLEPRVTRILKEELHRGRVEVRVDTERDPGSGTSGRYLNRERLTDLADELKAAARHAGLPSPTISDILQFPDIMAADEPPAVEEGDEDVLAAVRSAVEELLENRKKEGATLTSTMHSLVDQVEEGVTTVAEGLLTASEEFRTRLENRVREALERFGIGEIEEERLVQEVVFYADRSDISEELQRAQSHVGRLRELLDDESGEPRGKEIDFYLQEMVREANTMGSKTGDPQLTNRIIEIKSAVEKMREQAANIE